MPQLGKAVDSYPPDEGCEVAPRCIACPLPICKYDDMPSYRREKQVQTYKIIIDLVRTGLTNQKVASHLGIAVRTVQRAKEKTR